MSRDVVIPAGGSIDPTYAQVLGTPYRALAPFGTDRRPSLQIVVDALRASGEARRIIAVAPPPVRECVQGVDLWLESSDSGMENIRRGLAAATPAGPALVCTSDLPLLRPEHIYDFASRCCWDAEFSLGLVTQQEFQARFPDAPPSTFVTLQDAGSVTIAGLFQVHPGLLRRHTALFEQIFQSRKQQWRMAGLLGPRLLWQWMSRRLTLSALTTHAAQVLNCRVEIIHSAAPELAFDIDTPNDYAYTQTCFKPIPDCSA